MDASIYHVKTSFLNNTYTNKITHGLFWKKNIAVNLGFLYIHPPPSPPRMTRVLVHIQ